MGYTCEDGKRIHYSEAELGMCDLCSCKLREGEREMLFEFARKLNNYRRFESEDDVHNLIDEFLSSYDPDDQPERSKREDYDLVYVDYKMGTKVLVCDLFDPRRCGALNTVETQ